MEEGGGLYPLIWPIQVCATPKGIFSPVLVLNRVSILAILIINRVWFLQSSLKLGTFFRRSYFFIIIEKTDQQKPFTMSLTSVDYKAGLKHGIDLGSGHK